MVFYKRLNIYEKSPIFCKFSLNTMYIYFSIKTVNTLQILTNYVCNLEFHRFFLRFLEKND